MPVALLRRIAREELPVVIAGNWEVDVIRILVLAGHLKATIPPEVRTLSGIHQPPATVTAIISLGRMLLQSFPPGRAPAGARPLAVSAGLQLKSPGMDATQTCNPGAGPSRLTQTFTHPWKSEPQP